MLEVAVRSWGRDRKDGKVGGKEAHMSTYPIEKILSEYENSRMNVEMAVGHNLQHTNKLYEAQTAANVSRYEMRGKIDTLENTVNALQAKVDRLTALIEKFLPKHKRKSSGQHKGQP